ncbi:nuclear transport factor 2 family protein [Thalassococcus sp. S3]|uniref:nuclear transport factor 2 family protein n=1 Tax=Thalassococcus sp. S3 TaxID=2017482 RepID=UPI001024732C|nr:nuclear transport factor 2 family protein [Thalassococcus sp. S3]QBF29754.1 hypothetical protein CFI11_00795 [Thalassococcus sp. S3]
MVDRITEAVAVAQVATAYTVATRNRDVAGLKQLFHENAVMSGYLGPDLMVGGPEPFYDHLSANEVSPDYQSALLSVEVTGMTACARVAESNLFGMSFVNDFHFVKTKDGWLITSKLFHADPPEGQS